MNISVDNKIVKITVINAFGIENRGDELLLNQCINEITEVFPNSQVHVVSFSPKPFQGIFSQSERIGNSTKGIFGKLKAIFYLFASYFWITKNISFFKIFIPKNQQKSARAIKNSNIIISCPGGYIHDTNTAYIVALFHIYLAQKLKKVTILAPQSIGPINGFFAKKITSFILSNASKICARENYTFEFLTKTLKLPHVLIEKTGDSAFWGSELEYCNSEIESEYKKLGINLSDKIFGITLVDWSFPNLPNPTLMKEKYLDELTKVIKYLIENLKFKVVVFNQVSEDLNLALDLAKNFKSNLVVQTKELKPNTLKGMFKHCKMFLGTRFHSCIFSLQAGIPTYAISYLPKTDNIMKELGLTKYVFNINNLNSSEIINVIEDSKNYTSEKIDTAICNYKLKNKNFLDVLIEEKNRLNLNQRSSI